MEITFKNSHEDSDIVIMPLYKEVNRWFATLFGIITG